MRCINRLVEANAGRIELDGVNLLELTGHDLQNAGRRIGMIFQAYNLVDRLTVMENVLTGRLGSTGFLRGALRRFPQADIDRAYTLLKRVGLDQYVNTRCDALSGGERQRVGVARALMQDPHILLADEPGVLTADWLEHIYGSHEEDLREQIELLAVEGAHE